MKTEKTGKSVAAFLKSIQPDERRRDCRALAKLMQKVTGQKPAMWGENIVGFGEYEYEYASGRKGSFLAVGFAPRKNSITIYIMPGYGDLRDELQNLGPHKLGKACLYIRKLDYIHLPTLKKIIAKGYRTAKKTDWTKIQRERQSMPRFVLSELKKTKLMDKFLARPAYQQNDYLSWIKRAKFEKTRLSRLEQMIGELKKGDVYMKMKWRPNKRERGQL